MMIQQEHTTSNHGDAETVCFVLATVALLDSVGGEGAAKQMAAICTDMMGGVVSVVL